MPMLLRSESVIIKYTDRCTNNLTRENRKSLKILSETINDIQNNDFLEVKNMNRTFVNTLESNSNKEITNTSHIPSVKDDGRTEKIIGVRKMNKQKT